MAGSFGSSSDEELISSINVTPLVDVVLVLLIIFLITAPILYQSAIKVQLPQAKTGEKSDKSSLMFTLSKDGKLTWDRESVDWKTLGLKLGALKEKGEQTVAMISADEATPHGIVIRLMDALRQAGITHFALNVEPARSN